MRRTKLSLLVVLFSVPALAQTDGTYLLVSTNTVTPTTPTTTIEIWATWDDPAAQFLFGGGDYDLTAGDGQFSNPVNVLNGPGSSTGVIAGNVISGAVNGRLYIPGLTCKWGGCPLGGPELLATYAWTTTDFFPRAVDLHTSNTSAFIVFDPQTGNFVEMYPDQFTPGSGVINVVPCYPDCDGNGSLDIFDFLCFQNSFVNSEPYACDCDPNPACDIFDFLCFQSAFVAGCP